MQSARIGIVVLAKYYVFGGENLLKRMQELHYFQKEHFDETVHLNFLKDAAHFEKRFLQVGIFREGSHDQNFLCEIQRTKFFAQFFA